MLFCWQRFVSWPVLSVLLGLTLLAAAALKGHEIATTELLEDSLLSSRWFLVLVVEWEIFFALWLLGGFYQRYPRTTHWVALLYFFAVFVVAVDSVLKGRPSCPCFGKAIVPPWIAAAFDLAVLLLLAAAPVSPMSAELQQRYRWFGVAGVFSAFGLLSLVTMVDYSTSGAVLSIRREPRLYGTFSVQRVRPTTEDFLDLLRSQTSLNLSADERLLNRQPNYGVWDVKQIQAWSVMELLASRQIVPTRWEKTDDGYVLVPAARFGKSALFWFGGVILLALSMLGLRWRNVVQKRKKALSGATDGERTSVVALPAAKCS
jgi:hypothetical protein